MSEPKNQADDPSDHVPESLLNDLRRRYEPEFSVPTAVDRAVMGMARRHLAAPRWRHPIFRLRTISAAAAAIGLAFLVWQAVPRPQAPVDRSQLVRLREDVDRNGRVDILDALALARRIESLQPLEDSWDMNRDGVVGPRDVDAVAMAAVRLSTG